MGEPEKEDSIINRFISVGKDLVTLLRDMTLLALAGLLLLFPGTFNSLLVNAGFKEGSIAGFKWEAKVLQADDALKSAQDTIAGLREQLDKSTKALEDMQRAASNQSAASMCLKTWVRSLHEDSRHFF